MLILIGNTTTVHSIELVTKVRVRLNSGRVVPQLTTTLTPKLRRPFGSSLDLQRAATQPQLAKSFACHKLPKVLRPKRPPRVWCRRSLGVIQTRPKSSREQGDTAILIKLLSSVYGEDIGKNTREN